MAADRLTMLLDMLKEDPNDSFLRYALALEHNKLDQLGEAIEALEHLRSNDTAYLATYYQLGQIYEKTEQPDKAILVYKEGIELATKSRDLKTKSELEEVLWFLED